MDMTHRHTESWTADKKPAWLTRVQDKFRKQEMQERNLTLDYMTKLTQLTQLLWLDVRELLSCCLSQCRNLNNYPCKGCAQTYKGEITARSNLNLIGCLTPTVDKANASRINSRWQSREETISDQTKSISAPYKPRLLNCEA